MGKSLGRCYKRKLTWSCYRESRDGSFEHDAQSTVLETEADLYIKDAILVFRALCKLSKKPISSEW